MAPRAIGITEGRARSEINVATREQVRQMQTAQPFRPFLVKFADGRSFLVRHPELVSCSLNGRELVVHADQGMHLIEMLIVVELVTAPDGETAREPKAKRRRPGQRA